MRLRVHSTCIYCIVPVVLILCSGCTAVGLPVRNTLRHPLKALSGGEGTVFDSTSLAFSLPAANLPVEKLRDFTFGNRLFNTNWVTAPASTSKFDGLGPTFNRVSCSACHIFDGRGRPPEHTGAPMNSMLVRLSMPGQGEHGGVKPHPRYGDQLQDRAITGVPAEGRAIIHYSEVSGKYPDGDYYCLRVPRYEFVDLNFGPLGEDVLFSPRVAPAVFGLGLLESVPEEMVLAFAQAQKGNADGISGRPNYVWDIHEGKMRLGRFGWKANQPSLRQQTAGAFAGDIGITNPDIQDEGISSVQVAARHAYHEKLTEIDENFFAKIIFYSRTLGVPARRGVNDRKIIKGEALFKRIGCAVCHIPSMKTGSNTEIPQLANQNIAPFTDLLLHDMGVGLADGRPDFQASGNEWRTPPLWGIGLVKVVNKHTFFLHDGRARNLEEAILWHGGEAQTAKDRFKKLSLQQRLELIAFLNSL